MTRRTADPLPGIEAKYDSDCARCDVSTRPASDGGSDA